MITRIAAFTLMTPDPDRLAPFYADALGFTRAGTILRLGAQEVWLRAAPSDAYPIPATSNAADLWFQHLAIVTSDIEAAYARAVAAGATAISRHGPCHLPKRSGGVTAWKFRDPDGHPLELLQFPSRAIPPRWQGLDALTLGIDHSAISVADVEASIAYYRDRFGFRVTARQTNVGMEQDMLDDLSGAIVDVVALAPPGEATPHLELLGYRPPGRAAWIADEDVAATRTVLVAATLGLATLSRDPDGHLVSVAPHPSG